MSIIERGRERARERERERDEKRERDMHSIKEQRVRSSESCHT